MSQEQRQQQQQQQQQDQQHKHAIPPPWLLPTEPAGYNFKPPQAAAPYGAYPPGPCGLPHPHFDAMMVRDQGPPVVPHHYQGRPVQPPELPAGPTAMPTSAAPLQQQHWQPPMPAAWPAQPPAGGSKRPRH